MAGPWDSKAAKKWLVKVKIPFAETQNQPCVAALTDASRLADAA
jgi:hypothetical protein